ncbi:dTMP kinase [bacterium]|nr:dTMP kinase [bacterium]
MYIVFEGIVGTGKTTQSKLFSNFLTKKYPNKKVTWTREPGGSEIADQIRKLVQGTKFKEKMDPVCDAYLYAASRAQTLRTVVKPELTKGNFVVSDRNFLTSLSFQAFGMGLGMKKVWKINSVAVGDIIPDLIFFLDLDLKTALTRTQDLSGDKWESMDENFFITAKKGYIETSKLKFLKDKIVFIDAKGSIDQVQKNIQIAFNKNTSVLKTN